MYLNSKIETIHHTTYKDVNDFLLHHLGRKYEFDLIDEWEVMECNVDNGSSDYEDELVNLFRSGSNSETIYLSALLNNLCQDGWMEPGYYIIGNKHET